jgi:hypothetical protein
MDYERKKNGERKMNPAQSLQMRRRFSGIRSGIKEKKR